MRLAAILLVLAIFPLGTPAQSVEESEKIWREFLEWYRNSPSLNAEPAYHAKLIKDGMPEAEAERRSALIGRLAMERTEAMEIWFNRIFSREKPVFRTEANALLMETVKELKPGRALDIAMGQGRNSIWLASQGWDVAGFDVSTTGLAAARAEAEKRGLKIKAVHSGWQNFDFGSERWDLIVLSYAFVPVWDPAFVDRLRASLKKDGLVVFEHFLGGRPEGIPRFAGTPEPNELPRVFLRDFRILRYEDTTGVSDWGFRKAQLVRMVAAKM